MEKLHPRILLSILLVGSIGYLAGVTDEYVEVNTITGASRTKMRYAYVFSTPWDVRSNWVAESALRQGISTEAGWRQISRLSMRLIIRERACATGPAHASDSLRAIKPDDLNLTTSDEIDHFVREFIFADEAKRKEMISNW